MPSDTEDIKNRINIVDLVGEYVPLKKAGANFRGLCPFHDEKTPSFMVSAPKQIWHCFGCGMGGDHFEFIQQMEGVDFREALQMLARRAGVRLTAPSPIYKQQQDKQKILYDINEWAAKYYARVLSDSSVAEKAREYLKERGFKPGTIEKWRLGFAPDDFHTFEKFIVDKGFQKKEALEAGLLAEKDGQYYDRFRNRIMFPLLDTHSRAVAFTARILEGGDQTAKYINSPETPIYNKSELVYGLNFAKTAIRQKEQAVVVEGNVDVITAHEAGFENVIGSSGTALTEAQLQSLSRLTESLIFAFDVDEAGLAAGRRAVELALKEGFTVRMANLSADAGKDPDEIIRNNPEAWQRALAEAPNFLDFYFEQTFAKINLEKSEDKKLAVRELLPLIALLPDPVDRSHFVKELSSRIGLEEKALLQILNQHQTQTRTETNKSDTKKQKRVVSKLEILEKRALGLLLKFAGRLKETWNELKAEDFATPELKTVFGQTKPLVVRGEFSLEDLVEQKPELAEAVKLLAFGVENELTELQDWDLSRVEKEFLGSMKREALKRKMQELAAQIRRAESQGEDEQARDLSLKFNNLSKRLNQLQPKN